MSWLNAYNGHMRHYRSSRSSSRVKRYHIQCASAVKRSHTKLTRYAKCNIWRKTK